MSKKSDLIYRLRAFKEAHYELLKQMDESYPLLEEHSTDYPFEQSLEELPIDQWVNETITSLEENKPHRVLEPCVSCGKMPLRFTSKLERKQYELDSTCQRCSDKLLDLIEYKVLDNGWSLFVWFNHHIKMYDAWLTDDESDEHAGCSEVADEYHKLQIIKELDAK